MTESAPGRALRSAVASAVGMVWPSVAPGLDKIELINKGGLGSLYFIRLIQESCYCTQFAYLYLQQYLLAILTRHTLY